MTELGFHGLGAAGPDHAGAFAPGYGAWLADQNNRDWEAYAAHHPWRSLLGNADWIARLRQDIAYLERYVPHTARQLAHKRELLELAYRRQAVIVAGAPHA